MKYRLRKFCELLGESLRFAPGSPAIAEGVRAATAIALPLTARAIQRVFGTIVGGALAIAVAGVVHDARGALGVFT